MKNKSLIEPKLIKKSDKEYHITLSTNHIKELMEKNLIDKTLGEHYLDWIEKNNHKFKEWNNYIKTNPSEEAKNTFLTKEMEEQNTITLEKHKKDWEQLKTLQNILIENWEVFFIKNKTDQFSLNGLFNLPSNKVFGISRQISDPVSKMKEILKNAGRSQLKKINDTFIIEAKTSDSYGNIATLTYHLDTNSEEEAATQLKKYKEKITGVCLKAWMGYWRMANEHKSLTYRTTLVDVMNAASNTERKAQFSVKEKEEFFYATEMLKRTFFKTMMPNKEWIEQPLLDILGGKNSNEKIYPEEITVSVLRHPHIKFNAVFIPKNISNIHASLQLLTLYILNRASQLKKGTKLINLTWVELVIFLGLERTYKSNKRMAKSQIKKKIDQIKNHDIIDDWQEYKNGITINPKSQKKINFTT